MKTKNNYLENINLIEVNPLQSKRILVCGKGGSGKSSILSLIGNALQEKEYSVIMLDGDASNPGGLCRLLFGDIHYPKPLIEYFGGRELVECPVDNPKPLTRINETIAITEKNIDLAEIPAKYIVEKNGIKLLQVGKINQAFEGCDGPMSKISRDFIVIGNYVTLLDVEAGIEHFGRGIEQNVDIILTIVDPTFESFIVAEKVISLAQQMNVENTWAILNKFRTREIEYQMMQELENREIKILGSISYDPEIELAGLRGSKLEKSEAYLDIKEIVGKLEQIIQSIAS